MSPDDPRLSALLSRLTLERKVQVLTGKDFWSTWPLPEVGLRSIVFSDGPAGVRGIVWDERDPSLSLPSGTALGATWDRDIATRYGAVLAVEARRKNVDVVLGPTINLHRSPLGGRHFEALSEDPLLTGELAAAYVSGLQGNGIAATPKHYVANEAETDRFTANSAVPPRALHELYLRAFEKAVVESRSWVLMSAYNSINGVTASENDLLQTPLRSDWGFDGVVVSDWTAVRSINAANAEQDLAMPGPDGAWGERLVQAVRDGIVSEAAIDRKVLRILALASRVGALEGFDREHEVPALVEDGKAFARTCEAAAMVLVKNDGLLPLAPETPKTIAVIGHGATAARTMGGGSATVIPDEIVTPLEAIRAAYPHAEVTYSIGAIVQAGIAGLPSHEITNPTTGTPGLHVRFLNTSGSEIYSEERLSTELVWLGSRAPIADTAGLDIETVWTPTETGTVRFGIAATGTTTVYVDGEYQWKTTLAASGDDLAQALLAPLNDSHVWEIKAGQRYQIRIHFERVLAVPDVSHAMSFIFGLTPVSDDCAALLNEAATAASMADAVVLIVGTNSEVESEGFDREHLDLPGNQDALAKRVLAANPKTIVVVNSGAPVLLPWRHEAAAIVLSWFGGQEFGKALADVLTGAAEPGGRLPTTWPDSLKDVPVIDVTPHNGVVEYSEGINIGYRAWLQGTQVPAWPFGHGLGYTSWRVVSVSAPNLVQSESQFTIDVTLKNTGSRPGKQVVQVYASRKESEVVRPVRWLVGFESVTVDAGETATVQVAVSTSAFSYWGDDGWNNEPGPYSLAIGFDVESLVAHVSIELQTPAWRSAAAM